METVKAESGFEETTKDNNRGGKSKGSPANNVRKTHGRVFDRHSGSNKTGVKPMEKRDGSGSHNWGNVKDIVELENEGVETSKDENVIDKPSDSELPVVETDKKEAEKTMTMSEWKALNKENAVISSTLAARPANNGEDVFSGMNVYKKRTITATDSDTEITVPDDEIDSKGRRHIKVNVEFSGRSRRSARGGGGPGGVGGGFNNSRFNNKEEKKNGVSADVLINDENEFPTLS